MKYEYEIYTDKWYVDVYDENRNVINSRVFNSEHDAWNWAADRVAELESEYDD